MAMIIIIYLLLGTVLESLSMILLTVPIFYPLMYQLDFGMEILSDTEFALIWFGIIVVVVTEISLITPPIGMNVFVLKATLPDVSLKTIFKGNPAVLDCRYFAASAADFLSRSFAVAGCRLGPASGKGGSGCTSFTIKGGKAMGEIVLAAKATHVPTMVMSEQDGNLKGCRQAAIDGHAEIGRRAREAGADTFVVLDTHWLVNAALSHQCQSSVQGSVHLTRIPSIHQGPAL